MCDSKDDTTFLSILQEPLQFIKRPFATLAGRLGSDEEGVLEAIRHYVRRGIIRRFAGIIKHDGAGYRCNAMVAFEVNDESCDAAGEKLSLFPFITHCYRRTAYPDWPYNLYAMVHAHDPAEFERHLDEMKQCFAYNALAVLPSSKEFKKTHFRLPVSGKPDTP